MTKPRVADDLSLDMRVLRARIGAFALHATHDPRETSRAGRDAQRAARLREVDPDGLLPEHERERRADALMHAHMLRMQLARRKEANKKRSRSSG